MTAVVDQVLITEPGVYALPADVYHADPVAGGSLSSSGAKKLLACPASGPGCGSSRPTTG